MKTRKIISALLAVLLLLPVFASCSEKPGDDKEKPTTDALSPEATASGEAGDEEPQKDMLDAREDVSDEVPDADFGGRTFRIALSRRDSTSCLTPTSLKSSTSPGR